MLPGVLQQFSTKYQAKPQAVMATWSKVIGSELSLMTRATRFEGGILYVAVKNSTLLSLLSNPVDKQKILQTIRQTLPGIEISNIVFRIG